MARSVLAKLPKRAAAPVVPTTPSSPLTDEPGFWPIIYSGTLALGLVLPGSPIIPAIAAVGLLGAHAYYR
jgi:hypothetical protein